MSRDPRAGRPALRTWRTAVMALSASIASLLPVGALGADADAGHPTVGQTPEGGVVQSDERDADQTYRELERFARVLAHIENSHLSPPDARRLVDGAIKGMVATLDPHSAFLTAQELEGLNAQARSGESASPGIILTMVADGPEKGDGQSYHRLAVLALEDGSPAAKAGILPGDRITHIDGVPTARMGIDRAMGLLMGRPETRATIGIYRKGFKAPRNLVLVRAAPIPRTVDASVSDGIVLLRIHRFGEGTGTAARMALAQAADGAGGSLKGVVLDLRNNPGGRLDEAAQVADLFLPGSRNIYFLEGRNSQRMEAPVSHAQGTQPDYPMAVLVNEGTASAAEVVAGALQDEGRALLVGGRTFGKGTAQVAFSLEDGSALKLTVAQAKTPLRRAIHGQGLVPDILVAPSLGVPHSIAEIFSGTEGAPAAADAMERESPEGKEPVDAALSAAMNAVKNGLRPAPYAEGQGSTSDRASFPAASD